MADLGGGFRSVEKAFFADADRDRLVEKRVYPSVKRAERAFADQFINTILVCDQFS
jgi:hypothetical protein